MSLYQRKDSPVWWINISHPNHPRLRESTFTTDRAEAQRIHDEKRAELWKIAPVAKLKGNTWSKAVNAWLDIEERSESELLSLRKFGRHFPDRPLMKITGDDVEKALFFCNTAGTYMRYRTTIVAILNVAKKRKWIAEVPDIPVRRDKKKKSRMWLTHEQWDTLHDNLPIHLRAPAVFALNTGLRRSNVFGLRWVDVDLERKLVIVAAEDVKDNDHLAVPLNDEAMAALLSQKGLHHEFVFTFRRKPMAAPKYAFSDACRRAGVPEFTWHGFRHTWATWHIQNGTPVEVLQKLGGWADMRMVMNYAHHTPGYVAQYANNVRKK